MSPVVESFDAVAATPADVAAWSMLFTAGRQELSGGAVGAQDLAVRLRAERAGAGCRWAARLAEGEPLVGVAELRGRPRDGRVGFLRLFVAPQARRQGVGRLLREVAIGRARALGMDRLHSCVPVQEPGESFARASPYLRTLVRLELQKQYLDEVTLRRCWSLAATPARGYRLTHWQGPAPEGVVRSFGRVMGHLLDAPGAVAHRVKGSWGPARVREWERAITQDGSRLVVAAALDRTSDQVVAATVSTVAAGVVADQHDTAVMAAHRRRGLASRVKATQALRVHDLFPHVRALVASVDVDNTAMLGVNRSLLYERVGERLLVEESLEGR